MFYIIHYQYVRMTEILPSLYMYCHYSMILNMVNIFKSILVIEKK